MRFHKSETSVPSAWHEMVIDDVLVRRLRACENQIGIALPTQVVVCVGPIEEPPRTLDPRSSTLDTARLRFRSTIRSNRHLFQIEAIFYLLHPNGFSGLHLSGEMIQEADGIDLRETGVTFIYNNREWWGWR